MECWQNAHIEFLLNIVEWSDFIIESENFLFKCEKLQVTTQTAGEWLMMSKRFYSSYKPELFLSLKLFVCVIAASMNAQWSQV